MLFTSPVAVPENRTVITSQISSQGEGLLLFPKATAFITPTMELARFSPSAPGVFPVTIKPDLQR
jgi:hypothetical protein